MLRIGVGLHFDGAGAYVVVAFRRPCDFGDHGRAGPTQPNYGLDKLFGAKESYVEFTPDLLDKLTLKVRGQEIFGRYFLQEYQLAGGRSVGQYANGHIAAVEHTAGKGKTLLIGTFPGGGYYLHHSAGGKAFFAGLLEWVGIAPLLKSDNPATQARLHRGVGSAYLWVVNPSRKDADASVTIPVTYRAGEDVWGGRQVGIANGRVTVNVGARDAAVIALRE